LARFLITVFDGPELAALGEGDRYRASLSFLGGTAGPFLGADLRSGAPGAQTGSRRVRAARRGCLDAGEHPARLDKQEACGFHGFGFGLFEVSDEFLVVGLDHRFVGIRVVAGERDDLSIVFDCQFGIAADLVDQTETGVSVVDAREAFQQGIRPSNVRHSRPPGRPGTTTSGMMNWPTPPMPSSIWSMPAGSTTQNRPPTTCLVQAAALVFLATAAGTGFIAADLGHVAVSQ
jgi:hypothetical protein